MSKGLEIINNKLKNDNNKFDRQVINGAGEILFIIKKEELDIIEQELKELEKMKRIKGTTTLDSALENTLINACPNVAKKLKALEIIKEKRVNVELFIKHSLGRDYNEFLNYENLFQIYKSSEKRLTQEEYDLLKEVLTNV